MIKETTNNYNYSNTHKTSAMEDFELAQKMRDATAGNKEEVISAKEEASKSRIETFSNKKAKETNAMYEEYMNDSIKDNFATATELQRQKIAFEKEKADYEIAQKRKELEEEIKLSKKTKKELVLWRIFWPALGIILGALTYILLYMVY